MKPASVVLVVLLSALTAGVCAAQSNGVPASVTSFGFGGSRNTAPGVPASVTSVGPRGFGPSQCCATRFFPPGTPRVEPGNLDFHHHHGGNGNGFNSNGFYGGGYYGGYIPIYSYGGYYPGYSPVIVAQQEESAGSDEDSEESGPTVFEHRGSRRAPAEEAYSRGYEEGRAAAEDARHDHRRADAHAEGDEHGARKASEEHADKGDAKADEEPAPAVVVKTVLVYKDAHKEEIANYAIVGDQLFDFTNGRRKIAIADLDVAATTKANDERGVDFQLPAVRAKK
jgi:hypothetical protein